MAVTIGRIEIANGKVATLINDAKRMNALNYDLNQQFLKTFPDVLVNNLQLVRIEDNVCFFVAKSTSIAYRAKQLQQQILTIVRQHQQLTHIRACKISVGS